jgi:hypothetical protein
MIAGVMLSQLVSPLSECILIFISPFLLSSSGKGKAFNIWLAIYDFAIIDSILFIPF